MNTSKVLVIDDDPKMIELVQEILALTPCEALGADRGRTGLEILRRELDDPTTDVDAVLLDVRLPDIDGFEILKQLKADPRLKQIPVIFFTGVDAIADKTRGLGLGAEDYVTKPFDPQELLARLNVVLRMRRTEKELRRRNAEMAMLDEINRMVAGSLDLDQVLVSALEGLERLVDAKILLVILNDEDRDEWVVRTAKSSEDVWLEGRVVPLDGRPVGEALSRGAPLLRTAVVDSFWSEIVDMPRLDELYVPLGSPEQPMGLLTVLGEAHTLREEHVPLLERMAATVSITVENARLYGELAAFAEALERSQNQLIQAEKMAAVGRLTASIAHEINNPLQAVQNSLHLARHPGMDEEGRRRYLTIAQEEVEHLVHIVRRMLDFYRPASSTLKPIDVNRAIDNALTLAHKRFKQTHINVIHRPEPGLPPVLGSRNQLTQVFLNIILNAIEAMEADGELRIGTAYHQEREQVIAAFRDSGPGIAPEIRDHLFEPFHTTKSTGTGLGLAISYGIVEHHGGEIVVESPQEGGATFIVRLPAYDGEGHDKSTRARC
ncbi:MAG: response regulator [Anaerolineae bacterium]